MAPRNGAAPAAAVAALKKCRRPGSTRSSAVSRAAGAGGASACFLAATFLAIRRQIRSNPRTSRTARKPKKAHVNHIPTNAGKISPRGIQWRLPMRIPSTMASAETVASARHSNRAVTRSAVLPPRNQITPAVTAISASGFAETTSIHAATT